MSDVARDTTLDVLALVTAVGKDDDEAVHALLSGIEVRHLLGVTLDLAHALWAMACEVAATIGEDPQECWGRACALVAAGLGNDA